MFPFGRVMHARLYANLLLLLLVLVLVLALSVLVLACMYLALGWGWCGSMGAGGGVRVAWRTYCVNVAILGILGPTLWPHRGAKL